MAEDDQFSYPLTTFDQDTDYLMDTVEEISVGEYEEENTNLCPTSGADIQKIYGCNDISYAVSDCGSELCYCGSQPITHDTQPLGEYENEPARSYSPSQEEIDVSVAMLNDDKYIKQQELLVASKALLEQVLTNLKDIDDDLKSWENRQLFTNAVDHLCEYREMILYSYVFMYNLKNDNCTTMIENRLNDFQRMTEAFHGYLSQKITSRNLSVIKVIIQDLDRHCRKRKAKLERCIGQAIEDESFQQVPMDEVSDGIDNLSQTMTYEFS